MWVTKVSRSKRRKQINHNHNKQNNQNNRSQINQHNSKVKCKNRRRRVPRRNKNTESDNTALTYSKSHNKEDANENNQSDQNDNEQKQSHKEAPKQNISTLLKESKYILRKLISSMNLNCDIIIISLMTFKIKVPDQLICELTNKLVQIQENDKDGYDEKYYPLSMVQNKQLLCDGYIRKFIKCNYSS